MKKTIIEQLENKITEEMENKYFDKFCRQSRYLNNEIYNISGTNIYSTDTRELFLMMIAAEENIKYKN